MSNTIKGLNTEFERALKKEFGKEISCELKDNSLILKWNIKEIPVYMTNSVNYFVKGFFVGLEILNFNKNE